MIGLLAKDTSAGKVSTKTTPTATQTLVESPSNAYFPLQLNEQVL